MSEVRGNLDGKTLNEKKYGSGFRPEPSRMAVLNLGHCAAEPCPDPVFAEVETYVDDAPPRTDWYTTILSRVYGAGLGRTWVRIPLCRGHSTDFLERSLQVLEDSDLWAPGRDNPFVFPHPAVEVERG